MLAGLWLRNRRCCSDLIGSFPPVGSRAPKLDLVAAAAFVETVPRGHWTSYGDVAMAGGRSSQAAQGVVAWIGSKGHRLNHVYRVLNARGEISPAWTPAGPGLPADAREVREWLEAEGLPCAEGCADPARRWRARGS